MEPSSRSLPKNAYRPLEKGEVYVPFVPASQTVAETTARSIVLGVLMSALFTFATAYSGLKAGQVFEAAIPIAILAVGVGKVFARRSTILENVIIQSIGACSGVVVAGAIFTLPALFMLGLDPGFLTIFLSAMLGGVLGIVFLVPLRRYFVAEQHGQLPFPEATATTEILVTGEKAGEQASVLVRSMLIGGVFDFLGDTLRFWGIHFRSTMLGDALTRFTEKTKIVFKMDTTAFFVGLGYIVGLKYAAVICAGSFLSWFVLVPFFGFVQDHFAAGGGAVWAAGPDAIFRSHVRLVGIGAIAAAGLLGIIKNFKVIVGSFSVGFKGIVSKHASPQAAERTDRDLPMATIVTVMAAATLAITIFFFWVTKSLTLALLGLLIAFFISFLFTTVAARAIAIVGTNPVSGMTLVTLIIGSTILVKAGLSGPQGMMVALVIGSVVCTALSLAGGFITDLKIGYWLGSTPARQQQWKFLGTAVAALSVGAAIFLIDRAFGFQVKDAATGAMVPNPLVPAPQANVMKSIITTLMDPTATVPWMLYGIGMLVVLVLEMVKVPPLAFALGMYLPQELNTPLLLGGFVAWLLSKSSADEHLANARVQKGTLVASGLLAGSALMGVLGALLRIIPGWSGADSILASIWGAFSVAEDSGRFLLGTESAASVVGLVLVIGVAAYAYLDGRRASAAD